MEFGDLTSEHLSVLVAEGEPELRRQVRTVLTRMGLDTCEAADATETVDIVCSFRIDAIVLDNDLREFGGLETIRVIRTFHRVPPYLLLASALTRDLQIAALEGQATSVLPKPVDHDLLSEIVREMLLRTYGRPW